ncbi:MAG TPA: hypothetical protein VET26_05630 [Candidatus Sulfotelmatobacter sp.]|nr:hypothetical protein [Candidatus Sulfotelmatobacter sp.]
MRRLLVAAALAVGLIAASPGPAAASVVWCDWDPIVLVITPAGHLVPVYDSVWSGSALDLALPVAGYTVARTFDAEGRPQTQVDMAITVPTGLLFSYSTMDEVTTGLLGSGKLLARAYGTSGRTVHLRFTLSEA